MPTTASPPQPGSAASVALWLPADARSVRWACAALSLGAAAILALACALPPSSTGHGTHTGLFLPPCMLFTLTGVPCPFCGMTTAFSHMARGEVAAAFQCHVLGPVLYLLTWLVAALSLLGLATGRLPFPAWSVSSRFQRGVLVAILLAWGVQIWRQLA